MWIYGGRSQAGWLLGKVWLQDAVTEKNVQPRSWDLLLGRHTEDLNPRDSLSNSSDGLLQRGKERARIYAR